MPEKTMKLSCTLLSAVVWTVGTAGAFAQVIPANLQARSAGPTIFLSGPRGERSTLAYSPNHGWRLRTGWQAEDRSTPAGSPEQPLTVYLDGPTGYAFIYLAAEGWKFVGRIHDPSD
jgi:hypothetical protein